MNPDLLPALPRRQATVAIDIENNGFGLHMITLRLVRRAAERFSDISILNLIARRLKSELYRNLRRQLQGWTDQRIRRQLRFSIFMSNWNNLNNAGVSHDTQLSDLTGAFLEEMFERATAEGSNPDLEMYDLVWRVWVNPASIREGGAPSDFWLPGLVKTHQLKNDPGNIGCATLALAIGYDARIPFARSPPYRSLKFTYFCVDLQTQMQFEDPSRATVFELSRFVELYKNFRVCIIENLFQLPTIYTGTEYEFNQNPKQDLTIFIYHDLKKNHFAPVSAPAALAREIHKDQSTQMCYECCTSYSGKSSKSHCACKSNSGTSVKVEKKLQHCVSCGQQYFKSYDRKKQHRCGESQCKFCQQYYKTEGKGQHRCPLYTDPIKMLKVFKGDENEYFEKAIEEHNLAKQIQNAAKSKGRKAKEIPQYELWVWDIESHFVFTDAKTEEYEIDSNGQFVIVEGELVVKEVTKLSHLGTIKLTRQLCLLQKRIH